MTIYYSFNYFYLSNEPFGCFWSTWTILFRFNDISSFSDAVKSAKQRYVANFDGSLITNELLSIGFFSCGIDSIDFCTSVDNGWKNSSIGRDREIRSGNEIKAY
jgi:hypothetical protein